jgi:hypothetical protein
VRHERPKSLAAEKSVPYALFVSDSPDTSRNWSRCRSNRSTVRFAALALGILACMPDFDELTGGDSTQGNGLDAGFAEAGFGTTSSGSSDTDGSSMDDGSMDAAPIPKADAAPDASMGDAEADASSCRDLSGTFYGTMAQGTNWNNPNRALVLDGTSAVQNERGGSALFVTGFPITIPAGATISGLEVVVTRSAAVAGARDLDIHLVSAVPFANSMNLAKPGSWPQALEAASYGGPKEKWGISDLKPYVSTPAFGVSLQVTLGTSSGSLLGNARVDAIAVKVYFRACGP